jgi:hydroxymethylpyrimidine kinase/phosphomethylpyrimidine kinase
VKKKVSMAVGGFDTGGGAGIESDIKAMESVGVHGVGAITAITSQNTLGIREILPVSPKFLASQLSAILEDFDVRTVKTGMILDADQMKVVSDLLYHKPMVVDPVIYAKDGTKLIGDLDAFKSILLTKARVVTPNVPEAEALSGEKIRSVEDSRRAAKKIHETYSVPLVVVKGGHLQGEEVVDVVYDGSSYLVLKFPRIEQRHTHGTGSVFASLMAALMAKGLDEYRALERASSLIKDAIYSGLEIGKGVGPVDPMARLEIEAMKYRVFEEMREFADFVERRENFHRLIPEVQSNLAHGVTPNYVRGLQDIATFRGRIIKRWDGRVVVGLPPVFGYPTHTARLLLSIIQKGETADTLMNIRYDSTLVGIFRKIGYDVVEVNRTKEPPHGEGKTMGWLVEYVYSEYGRIPNVIYDRGAVGKEAMIRFWTSSIQEMMDSLDSLLKEWKP